jgi:hypothetical protein
MKKLAFAAVLVFMSGLRAVVPEPVTSAAPMIIGEVKETPDPQRLAISDKLYEKILARL